MMVIASMCFSFLPSVWDAEQKLCPNACESLDLGKTSLGIPTPFKSELPGYNEQSESWLFYLSNGFSNALT